MGRPLVFLICSVFIFGIAALTVPPEEHPYHGDISPENEQADEESDFFIHSGEIASGEDDDEDFLLMMNSTFKVVDHENSTASHGSSSAEESPAVVPASGTTIKPTLRLSKQIRPAGPGPNCHRFSEFSKYKMMENIGARNQLYMANTVSEASHHFVHLYPPTPDDELHSDAVPTGGRMKPVDYKKCGTTCQQIKKQLSLAESQWNKKKNETTGKGKPIVRSNSESLPLIRTEFSDGVPLQVQEGRTNVLAHRPCTLTYVAIGNCSYPDWTSDEGFHSLCSQCNGVYTLSENCFPRFLNTIKCNSSQNGCIFVKGINGPQGNCAAQYLTMRILRNVGDDQCEDWQPEDVSIPVACQCMLPKDSPFISPEPWP